jgi:hypothetical protein
MPVLFQILAVVLIAAAAFFLLRNDPDDAFITVVLGICAFFLAMRFRLKRRIAEREAARQASTQTRGSNDD